jgi:gliding motility-associated-like protein
VGRTNKETYTDTSLKNGKEYCYRIVSEGYRKINGIEYLTENWSHVACVTPIDNVAPCPPALNGDSNCDENMNQLEWNYVEKCENSEADDMARFRIYFTSDPLKYNYAKIDSVSREDSKYWLGGNRYSYSHRETLKGCYYVTAVDSAGNVSEASNIVCLDKCGGAGDYDIPNVFTPNDDRINDFLVAYISGACRCESNGETICKGDSEVVTMVDMKIFNRWGKLVYKTDEPCINWDGRDMDSNKFVPTGVYYYICDVYENRLDGVRVVPISGFVHVYRENVNGTSN